MYRLLLLIAFALFLLAGCAGAGRQPERLADNLPPFDSPLTYTADPDWWKAYNDPHLDRLVETALANNVDYAQTAVAVNRALYQARLIGADLFPSFSGSLSGSASRNIKVGEPSTRSVGGTVNLQYEVDLWRKLADSSSAAEWSLKATREDRESARLALINTVINAYFDLCYLEEALPITQETIDHYKRILDIAQARFETGKADSVEPAQARQSLLQAENSLIDLQTREKTAQQTLRDLLNAGPGTEADAAYPSLMHASLPPVDFNVPLAVLENRPDLRAAEYRLQSAFKDLGAMEKSWLPSITLGSSLGSSSSSFGTAFNVPVAGGSLTVNLPFLDWNRVYWNVKLSESEFDSAKLDFQQAVTTALNEVDAYNYIAIRAADTIRNTDEKYRHDQHIAEYYRQRWDAGSAELNDYLAALNTEASSRLALLSSRYTRIEAENRLHQALAGRYTLK